MNKKMKKNEETEKQLNEYKELLQRLQAEFENYRKRVEEEKQNIVKFSCQNLIENLLDVLDNFDLAFKNTENKESFIKGVELVYSQFYSILEKEGLKKIKTEGKFNPEFHEALMKQGEGDEILEELQPGYILNDKVIRPAKVKMGGKK